MKMITNERTALFHLAEITSNYLENTAGNQQQLNGHVSLNKIRRVDSS